MTVRPKVDWRVPSDEWDAFIDFVHGEHGEIQGYVSREVERAMLEWVDGDDYAPVEDLVDQLVRAAGHTPANLTEKKPVTVPPDGEETTRVSCRVDGEVKNNFAAFVKETSDDRLGVALARALRQRCDGGRARRVREKMERVANDAETLLADDGIMLRERRTVRICRRLGEQFTQDDLEDAIAAVAGDSAPTIRDYTEKVLARLEYVEHPRNGDLFISKDDAEDIATDLGAPSPDAPAIDRKPYDSLSRTEKVRGVRIELARDAQTNGGKSQMNATTVRRDIFEDRPSPGHVQDLLRLAGDADGFDVVTRHGKERLRVDLSDVTDLDVLEAACDDLEQTNRADWVRRKCTFLPHKTPDSTGKSAVRDGEYGADSNSDTASVDEQIDNLLAAMPVTDGG
ncbi:hypothetical protein [Haloprofundus halophilus]|uniref:hypothetical protein n=1 Tax=Haloprofundus halophilus TaxID=2283527 RepID=UPI001E424986|nr:hypothetical protein [Haloprofundus halophilus]